LKKTFYSPLCRKWHIISPIKKPVQKGRFRFWAPRTLSLYQGKRPITCPLLNLQLTYFVNF